MLYMNLLQKHKLCFLDQISLGVKLGSPVWSYLHFLVYLHSLCEFSIKSPCNYFLKSLEGIALLSSLMPTKEVLHSWRCPSVQTVQLPLFDVTGPGSCPENAVFCLLHVIPVIKAKSVSHCCKSYGS